jgi:Bacterial Ig-like domain (group 3)/MBG domain (YGX type)
VVTKGVLTVTANNATRVYGTANPSFSGSVTGAVDGDTFTESFTTAATITSNAGKYSIVPAVTGANVADYSVTTVDGTLMVTQAASSAAITSSFSAANPGTSVTFTVTITSSTTGTPTGSVQFLNGTTVLGTSTLNNQGVATLMTSALPSGTDAVQAVYVGDENFSGSTASITETITTPGFSLSVNPTQLTIVAGQSGKATITLTPASGYMGTETFSCSGLPQYSTCTFQPASLTADGSNTPVTTTMTIATNVSSSGATASLERKGSSGSALRLVASITGLPALLTGLMLVCTRRRVAPWIYRSFCAAMLMAGLAAVVALQGCGGGGSNGSGLSTPIGTSTIKMSASAGGASQSIDITVVITH